MAFYRKNLEDAAVLELRNDQVLVTGPDTRNALTYPMFLRSLKELEHYGYEYQEACGWHPTASEFDHQVVLWEDKLKIMGEEFQASEVLLRTECKKLRLKFQHPDTKKVVFLYMDCCRGSGWDSWDIEQVLWLSELDEDYGEQEFNDWFSYEGITIHFADPVFGVLKKA